jgi:hypothetical protein
MINGFLGQFSGIICMVMITVWSAAGLPRIAQQDQPPKGEKAELMVEQQYALSRLGQIAEAAQSFSDLFERAQVQAHAADLLWSYDEPRARQLFVRAFQVAAEVKVEAGQELTKVRQARQLRSKIRHEVLSLLSQHDPNFAQQLATQDETSRKGEEKQREADLKSPSEAAESLVQLARQAVKTSPREAFQLGLRSLQTGELAPTLTDLLRDLIIAREAELEGRLYQAGLDLLLRTRQQTNLGRWLSYTFLPSGELRSRRTLEQGRQLLSLLFETVEQTLALRQEWQRRGQVPSDPNAQNLCVIAQLRSSAFHRYDAERWPIFEQMVRALTLSLTQQEQKELRLAEAFQLNDPEAQIERADRERDPEVRDAILHHALITALERRQEDLARRIAPKITDLKMRAEAEDEIGLRVIFRLLGQPDFDAASVEARRLHDDGLRALVFSEIASRAQRQEKDPTRATMLLEEAYLFTKKVLASPSQVRALLKLGEIYAPIDPLRAFEALGDAVKSLNNLPTMPAKQESSSKLRVEFYFEVEGFSTQDRASVERLQFGPGVERLAQFDYWRANALAQSIKNEVLRARMELAVARGVLGKKSPVKAEEKQ